MKRYVELPFAPRPWQIPLIDDPAPRIVSVVHRRAGKSTALLWRGIKRALTTPKPLPRVVHLLPLQVQWRRTGMWDQAKRAAAAIDGARALEVEMAIRLPNGAVWQAGGSDNPDSWRGGYADEVVADEFDDMPDGLISMVIEPMLADRDGVLIRSGTPKGHGRLADAYQKAAHAPGYSRYLLTWRDTHALSDEAVERLRQEMTDEEFAQEMECSFTSPNSGSYYGKLLDAAESEGRVCSVPYDPRLQVCTGWDLGMHDSTIIWFVQITRSGEWRWIDYIEDSGAGLDHYVKLMRERPYVYEKHYLPHDVEVDELGTGRSRRATLNSLGVRPIRTVPAGPGSVADGIQALRGVLPRSWFDAAKCAAGIKALRHYRREWNEAARVWRANPLHDWASHGSDAARYLARGALEPSEKKSGVTPILLAAHRGGNTAWMGA